jgi:hypothetical protein
MRKDQQQHYILVWLGINNTPTIQTQKLKVLVCLVGLQQILSLKLKFSHPKVYRFYSAA